MNLHTLAEWIDEIDEITGGSVVELRQFGNGVMTISVRWKRGDDLCGFDHAISREDWEYMRDGAQQGMLDLISNAVREA